MRFRRSKFDPSKPRPVDEFSTVFTSGPLPKSKNRRSVFKYLVYTAVLAVFAFGCVKAYGFVDAHRVKDFEASSTASVPVTVAVPRGSSLTEIGDILVEAGVVESSDAFLAAYRKADAPAVSPGRYMMRTQVPAATAVTVLTNEANRQVVKLVVPEGWTASQVADRAVSAMGFTHDDWDKAAAKAELPEWVPEGSPLEGLLFPATYEFLGVETAPEVIDTMVSRADQEARRLAPAVKAAHLDMYEVFTVASLVQAEVGTDDYAKAAQVVYNRLEAGMALGLDTTVNYALGSKKVSLSAEDLAVSSPYNTYVNKGLPPSPINNPGADALDAAVSPEDGPWLYFITVNLESGKTRFTDSPEKFAKYKKELQKYLKTHPQE